MLDENDVIEILSAHLKQEGYEILQALHTTEKGVDLIAHKLGKAGRLFVEAKGGTSSREGSNRFGKPYTKNQVFDRVSKGFYSVVRLCAEHPKPDEVAFAGPDTPWFREYLQPIIPTAEQLGIKIFLVSEDRSVSRL